MRENFSRVYLGLRLGPTCGGQVFCSLERNPRDWRSYMARGYIGRFKRISKTMVEGLSDKRETVALVHDDLNRIRIFL